MSDESPIRHGVGLLGALAAIVAAVRGPAATARRGSRHGTAPPAKAPAERAGLRPGPRGATPTCRASGTTPPARPCSDRMQPAANRCSPTKKRLNLQTELAFGLTRDRRDGGAEVDVNRAYNEHWMDPKRLQITADKRTSLIIDPPDGRIPPLVPLTPEREKRRAALAEATRRFNAGLPNSYLDGGMPMRCIIRTDRPPYLPIIYNNTFQVFQSPGYVVIHVEMIHSARVIPVDGRPHIGKTLRQWLGDSRGRWDGNTLVVETTNFRPDDGVVYGNADPETFRIVERFTRVDANTINYTFTVEIRGPGRDRGPR